MAENKLLLYFLYSLSVFIVWLGIYGNQLEKTKFTLRALFVLMIMEAVTLAVMKLFPGL